MANTAAVVVGRITVDRARTSTSGLTSPTLAGPDRIGIMRCGSSVTRGGGRGSSAGRQGHRVIDPNADGVPRWLLPRGLIVVLGMTGLLVSVLALQQFASILAPVLLALVLVIGVHPLTGILRQRGVPLWLAVTITLIAVLALILGLAAALALSVARLATILPTYQDSFNQLVEDLRSGLASLGVGRDQIRAALDQISFSSIASLLGGVLQGSPALLECVVPAVRGGDHGAGRLGFSRSAVPGPAAAAEVVGALDTFVHGTRSYLVVSTVFGLIVAASTPASSGSSGCRYRCCGGFSPSSRTTSPTSGS